MDGYTFDAQALPRPHGSGLWEVRAWVQHRSKVRVSRLPTDSEEDADDLAAALRRHIRTSPDPFECLPGGGEDPS